MTNTSYTVPLDLLIDIPNLNEDNFRISINKPTGRFFYDPWIVKDEFKNTIWEDILKTLHTDLGEARLIVLKPGSCYQSHADIDDRYHLNIEGEECYLIDLDDQQMFKLKKDGIWYLMNAGKLHTAVNFGRRQRVQLVVRKLLINGNLKNPIQVRLTSSGLSEDDARFMFDKTLSPWLNKHNKIGVISEFEFSSNFIQFNLEKSYENDLRKNLIPEFIMETK